MNFIVRGFVYFSVALFVGVCAGHVRAQDAPIVISTGGPKGTYASMFRSIAQVCGDKVPLVELPSTGSDENIDNLINRKADAAFVQTDTLQFTAMNDTRAGEGAIRTLVPLHPEEVHVVALANLAKVTGGLNVMGKNFGGNKQQLNSLADLEGAVVGAWGGSYTTARAIGYLGSVKYEVLQFNNDKEALAALNEGKIAAIIAVGGQPLGFVQGLNNSYKLLKIDGGLASKVKAYQPTRISYRNMGASGLETVAARAILVVRNFTTPQRKAPLAALKQCLLENESTFKEATGHHPKWADVDLKAPTVWAMYDVALPTAAPAATPAKTKK